MNSAILVENWATIIGALGTIAAAFIGLIRWIIKVERKYMMRDELKEELKDLEGRLQKRIDDLDRHVETMTAMWVAKGPA